MQSEFGTTPMDSFLKLLELPFPIFGVISMLKPENFVV